MTNQEFSDQFDTLLNSYANQAQFGEQAAKNEIVLDEYEKSVLLTNAQDIVVKSYFDRRHNSEGDGFDDSTRRQVDFSSLIKVATLEQAVYGEGESPAFDDRGIMYKMPCMQYPSEGVKYTAAEIAAAQEGDDAYGKTTSDYKIAPGTMVDKEGTTDVLFILNEKLTTTLNDKVKTYVVVPINYKEYDREMTKAYAQPLKKQAWRLFQNDSQGFDVQSELIPRWNLEDNETNLSYKIRYIKRPNPIVLVDLPNNLEIDGFTQEQSCELNPILHPEILQKALELAIATRGGMRVPTQEESSRR